MFVESGITELPSHKTIIVIDRGPKFAAPALEVSLIKLFYSNKRKLNFLFVVSSLPLRKQAFGMFTLCLKTSELD
jgi:hypothetical protein